MWRPLHMSLSDIIYYAVQIYTKARGFQGLFLVQWLNTNTTLQQYSATIYNHSMYS